MARTRDIETPCLSVYLSACLDMLSVYSGECCVAALCDGDGHTLRQVDTSFCLILKTLPWVPAMVTKTGGEDHNISTDHQVMVASMLFKQDPHIERLLSNHVPYLHAKVRPITCLVSLCPIICLVSPYPITFAITISCLPNHLPCHFNMSIHMPRDLFSSRFA